MKRVLCLLFLALIVPVLLIPASAAEEYVFEWVNPEVMMLGDSYDFTVTEGATIFGYAGLVPEGTYTLSFLYLGSAGGVEIVFIDPLTLVYEDSVDGPCAFCTSLVELCDGADVSSSYLEVFVLQVGENSLLGVREPGETEFIPLGDIVSAAVLTPVASPMDVIMNGFASLNTTTDSIFQLIIENALLASFAAAGLIIVCVPIFIALKKSAR